ncbi:cobalt-precorrin 5A hydrolase [Companilactobacillus ginsenosidimutans]|uniref:Cobalamin biosynthesis protein CbiG n=1 Tax=Companilactobacillus ginsenosidimutans TaxID=1007676 RepID=A0A0H4QE51_9LACO|nr:cobalt-precorrin 5A hydrolase [Companilactobacillus ginsenosidimutans]AKP66212.1 cobalamin biosynthesis protein CbiG [Companilactobacillus ginsenosidimutans]
MSQNKSKIAIVSITNTGTKLGASVKKVLSDHDVLLYAPSRIADANVDVSIEKGEFTTTVQNLFTEMDCLILIMATGIAVRTISPVIEDKTTDPAVLVIDELGKHVISLLSGHVGGANEWTTQLSEQLGADPVITTATDTEKVASIDVLAKRLNAWYPNFKENTKLINRKLAEHEKVYLYVEDYFLNEIPTLNGFTKIPKDEISESDDAPIVIVSDQTDFEKHDNVIHVVPKLNALGVGCRKNVTYEMMQTNFALFMSMHHLAWDSIAVIASIDVKQNEAAIQYLANTLHAETEFHSAEELSEVDINYPSSEFVKKTVGVGNVASSSANFVSGNVVSIEQFKGKEITMALSHK